MKHQRSDKAQIDRLSAHHCPTYQPKRRWPWIVLLGIVVGLGIAENYMVGQRYFAIRHYEDCGDHRAIHNILIGGGIEQGPCSQ